MQPDCLKSMTSKNENDERLGLCNCYSTRENKVNDFLNMSGDVQRIIIQLVLSVLKHSLDQYLNGNEVATYVLLVKNIPPSSAIHVHILFLRDALEAQSIFLRENKGFCGICMKTIMLIENAEEAYKEKEENCLTSDESKGLIKVAESLGFTHQCSLGPAYGVAYKDTHRISMNDPVLAVTIWQSGLSNLFSDIKIRRKVAVGLNPNIRFHRYTACQHFGRHIDESVDLQDGKRTHYTLLIYLSWSNTKSNSKSNSSKKNDSSSVDPLVGGETIFYGSTNSIVAEGTPK